MGTCTGFGSSCNAARVALETRCHLGQTVKYDTITQLGRSANAMHHGIAEVVDRVLARQDIDWVGNRINGGVVVPAPETDCVVGVFPSARVCCVVGGADGVVRQDCYDWTFGDFKNTSGKRCMPWSGVVIFRIFGWYTLDDGYDLWTTSFLILDAWPLVDNPSLHLSCLRRM